MRDLSPGIADHQNHEVEPEIGPNDLEIVWEHPGCATQDAWDDEKDVQQQRLLDVETHKARQSCVASKGGQANEKDESGKWKALEAVH